MSTPPVPPDRSGKGPLPTRVLRTGPSARTRTDSNEPPMQADQNQTGPWLAAPAAAEQPRLAGYEILGELGRGGMGIVYKARQIKLKRVVALKMVRAGADASAEALDRFRTEAEAVARLQHPNIVQIYEVGEHEGQPFFSLEFMPGGSLARKIGGKPQTPRRSAQLVETLARAMHAAHQRGIVHRDLKPENVLLIGEANTPLDQCVPKIGDFGLAKTLDDDSGRTRAGAIMGTPSYMAPEQADGRTDQIGPACDVYALGGILYELLTGQPPFRGKTALETIDLVRRAEPLPPCRLRPKLPRDLETICLKCLRKEPARRYASAAELADDLQRFLDNEPIHARRVGRTERAIKWVRRRPALSLTVLTLMLLVLGSVGGYWLWQQRVEKQQEYEREHQRAEEADQQIEEAKLREKEAEEEHIEYYANWVRRWGRQEGIGRPTAEQAHHRGVSYRIHRRGGRDGQGGLIESADRINGHGRPSTFDPFLSFTGQRSPTARSGGICSYRYRYGKDGKLLAEEARDEKGVLLYTFHYTSPTTGHFEYHDRLGLLATPAQTAYLQFKSNDEGLWTEMWNLDAKGQLVSNTGCCGWTVDYAPNGQPVRRIYRDAQRHEVAGPEGATQVAMRYDEQGNLIEEAYYDAGGKPTFNRLKGCHKIRWRYDADGNQIEQTYFGFGDEIFAARGSIARWTWRVDEHGDRIEEAYWDAAGKAVAGNDGTARWTARHDNAGNRIEETHFGTQGERIITPAGWSRWMAAYDKQGNCTEAAYFGVHDQPVLLPDGYHRVLRRHDARGNRIEERYQGVDGLPKANRNGVAVGRARYDDRGRCIEESYFGVDERPVKIGSGYACLKIGHDEKGNRNEETYFDGEGKPVEHVDGYHKKKMRCDERGITVEEAYFHSDGTPALHREGYARRELKRMLRFPEGAPHAGETLEVMYFYDTQGERTWHRDGYFALGRHLDPRGRLIEMAHYNANNLPCLNVHGVYSIKRKYDSRGNNWEMATFGLKEERVLQDDNYARITWSFDALGRRGQPVFWGLDRNNAYLRCQRTLNARGQVLTEAYFTVQDEPAVHRYGYHRKTAEYDERGNLIEAAFFGLDGKPARHANGYARLRLRYADGPQPADAIALDLDGKPLPFETVVNRVAGGGEAYRLGLKAGDVLVKYDGEEIVNYARFIHHRLGEPPSDPPHTLTVRRGKEMLTFSLRPGLLGCQLIGQAKPPAANPKLPAERKPGE